MEKFTGVLWRADTQNKNGRIYSKSIIEAAIANDTIKEQLQYNLFLGGVCKRF